MKKQATLFKALLVVIITISSCNTQNKAGSSEEPKPSIAEALAMLPNATIAETIGYYHKLKKENPEAYNFKDEAELNRLGYQYLHNDEIEYAIAIFKLLVSEFPASSNAYDSLGEAYYANKNHSLSLKNYQKSLELNPDNSNAANWIDRIKYPTIDKTKFAKVYSRQQYIEDIDTLTKNLTTRNPHPYRYMSKADFWKVVDEKKGLVSATTTFSEFIWHCSELVANINCGHSGLGYFNQESAMLPIALRFPMELRLINDKLYVTDPLANRDNVRSGAEILEINGKAIAEIMSDIYKHIKSQAKIESAKKLMFNSYSTAYIPYTLGFPKSYAVLLKGKKQPLALNTLQEYQPKTMIAPDDPCQDNLCLTLDEAANTALMTIRSFAYYGNRFDSYTKFLDNGFKDMRAKGINNLILDVRMNGGGPSDAGIYLLRYLAKEPFVYFAESAFDEKKSYVEPFNDRFTGRVYGLIDGGGGSTTGHFMSLVKHLKLATLIGEELGSNQFCTGGQISFRLPHTEIFYAVGRYTYVTTADSFSDERGVMPDYELTQSIEDYNSKVDTVLEYAKALIAD